jgi:phospholipase C
LFYTYDENGGFFDHVPPPTAPAGTPGEYLTVANPPGGVAGPIGLGFRVPMLVISPFSRGGFVASSLSPSQGPDPAHTYDHTSLLRFLETRFGVEVPNLSAWRRSATGDLTPAFNFAAPDSRVPKLPLAPPIDQYQVTGQCAINSTTLVTDTGQSAAKTNVPFPSPQVMPQQYPGNPRQPSGPTTTRSASRLSYS